jgi:hypothetical protein
MMGKWRGGAFVILCRYRTQPRTEIVRTENRPNRTEHLATPLTTNVLYLKQNPRTPKARMNFLFDHPRQLNSIYYLLLPT